jgi:hypothetical protein
LLPPTLPPLAGRGLKFPPPLLFAGRELKFPPPLLMMGAGLLRGTEFVAEGVKEARVTPVSTDRIVLLLSGVF